MLSIKNKHHLDFSYVVEQFKPGHQLELAPVPADDGDELTEAINNDPVDHDDQWELVERPDASELSQFWDEVVDAARKDPDWTFADEGEA